jgi:hypothetical protein
MFSDAELFVKPHCSAWQNFTCCVRIGRDDLSESLRRRFDCGESGY